MKQYLELLQAIKEKGTYKPAAKEGMPGTQSLFGYQLRHNLSDGFPLLTTKKMFWKGIVIELLWFLRGDTNIKYLVDRGVRIWDEDAYNYYVKLCKKVNEQPCGFEGFKASIEVGDLTGWRNMPQGYRLGDCGYQYGKVWRDWDGIDQIKNVIQSLKKTPESRRHIVTAIDPLHETDLALYWCHAMFQFNCRPIPQETREEIFKLELQNPIPPANDKVLDDLNIPKYYLDCHLYQRSCDVFLGMPFNIASYALLTHIMARICNMVPGEFIHTYGDVHIYDNHKEQVDEQLKRIPGTLPDLKLRNVDFSKPDFDAILNDIEFNERKDVFDLEGYNPQGPIKAVLSTGMKK